MNILAIDIGTTSMRGILYDETGRVLGSKSVQTPLVYRSSFIEQKPSVYTDALLTICKDITHIGKPDAVSVTAFRSAPVLVDKEGNALCNFIMWQDTRNREICERLAPHNATVRKITGARVNAVFTASKITWLKENEPSLFKKAYKALIVPDYLMHFMTGTFATDYTYGSRTSLMDLKKKEWDNDMFALFGLPREILSDLVPQGSVYGRLSEGFAKTSGLPSGIPVITAGGDQQCGALGLGAVTENQLVINCGTGSFVIGLLDKPHLQDSAAICNVAAIPGKYTIESNILSSAASLDWFLRTVFPDLSKNGAPDYNAFNELAASAGPLSEGVSCVPLFQGCGTRNWNPDARAVFAGLSLSTTRAGLARSMYEGLAAEIVKSIRALPAQQQKAKQAFLGGGMTKSDVFSQILCDMSGMNLVRYEDAQATAIGAFIRAAVTLNLFADEQSALDSVRRNDKKTVFTPDEANTVRYEAVLENTEQICRALNGTRC